MELLAQTVEALSVLTTKKFATKEPRKIKRPDWVTGGKTTPDGQATAKSNPFAAAIDRVFSTGTPRRAVEGEYVGAPPPHLQEALR